MQKNTSFKDGDCILAINSSSIDSTDMLANELGFVEKGEVIVFELIRKEINTSVVKKLFVRSFTK